MSAETSEWLHNNVLVGRTDKYGSAWWNRTGQTTDGQANHFDGFIDVDEVDRRLFSWEATYEPIYRRVVTPTEVTNPLTGEVVTIDHVSYVEHTDHKMVVHGDNGTVFNIVSPRHGIHQYRQALLDNVAAILDEARGDLGIASAGLLDGGGTAWVQIEPPEGVEFNGDRLYPFLCAYSSHTGQYATQYRPGSIRTVCDNTLALFDRTGGDAYKIRHTLNSRLDIVEARRVIDVVFAQFDVFAAEVERLLNTKVTAKVFDQVLTKVYPIPAPGSKAAAVTRRDNRVAAIRDLYENDPRVAPWAGTAWGVVNAFNTFNNHLRPIRSGATRFDRNRAGFLTGRFAKDDLAVAAAVKELASAAV